jgi:hypothetical protein
MLLGRAHNGFSRAVVWGGVVSADATPRPDDRLALPDCRRGDGLDSRPVRQSKASHRVLLIDWYLWTLICEWHLISDRA